jgi:hypothetical protein
MSNDWKRYPVALAGADPAHFTFPRTDGLPPGLGMSTYYTDGFVTGAGGRRYAFNFVFTAMRLLARRVHTNFLTFTLFDLDGGTYGTYTEFDFPGPSRLRRGRKLTAAADHLDVRFVGVEGVSRWTNRRDQAGALVPFASDLALRGRDQHGQRMRLELSMDAGRPPVPLGGPLLDGRMMFLGGWETYAYFQAGLRMEGRLAWGDTEDSVSGDTGWIDRQWAPRPFTTYNDLRSSRYRSEWRALHLDNGWDLCVFSQYQRPAFNRVVPWTGATAIGPDGTVIGDPDVCIEVPAFIRDPGTVRPLLRLSPGPRYMPHRFRLRVPSLELDVAGEPFVDAPAQRMPIEYWTGPVALRGTMAGTPVAGLGFDERSRVWCRDFELAEVLATTIAGAGPQGPAARRLLLHAQEAGGLLLRGARREAAALLRREIAPAVGDLPADGRAAIGTVLEDLLSVVETRVRAR